MNKPVKIKYKDGSRFQASKLILGTVQLGMHYGISNSAGKPDSIQTGQILKAAIEAGINTFDTSPSYGNAEELIGNFLETTNETDDIQVVTKFKISNEHLHDGKAAEEAAFRSVFDSLNALRLKRIPVLLLHKDPHQPLERVMDLLPGIFSSLKKEGLVDITGISAYHPADVAPALGNEWIEAVQVPINVFDLRLINNGTLKELKKRNKIVFARSIFLQGLIFMSPGDLPQKLAPAGKLLESLKLLAKEADMTMSELAFSFVRDLEGITSLVFGAVNREEVQQNVALLKAPVLPEEIRKSILKKFETVAEEIITPGLWKS